MTHSKTLSLLATFALTSALSPALGCGGSKADTATPEPAPAPAPVAQEKEEPAKPPAQPIPDGYFSLTPQLTVKGVDEAVDFYVKALGAEELMAMPGPDGKTMHAEIKIGDSIIMLDEENLEHGMKSPLALGGSSAGLMAYVDDVDAAFVRLTEAGATEMMAPEDQFWGDRYAAVVDPFGHRWSVATHLEELSEEQMMQRAEIAMAPAKKKGKAKKKGEPAWKKIAGTPAESAKPAQYHSITPSFFVANAAEAIEFYKAAFGATEVARMPGPDGKLMHAEVKIGDSILMLADEWPEAGQKSATTIGGSAVALHLYTENADAVFAKATEAAAKPAMPMSDAFWGDRYGAVIDPAGYMWGIATHTEDVTEAEMAERMKAQMSQS